MTTTVPQSPWKRCWPSLRRVMLLIVLSLVEGFALFAIFLYFIQDKMIYHPRPYASAVLQQLPTGLMALRDEADSLVGFYRPPREGTSPQRVWFLFGGNADQALGWDAFADEHAKPGSGFLMLEYPGFGACVGKPSPASILAANERAVALLAAHLGLTLEELQQRASAVAHSLGAAAALQYAAKYPLRRLVLISPFTSTFEMARRMVGWPLCQVLTHRFDNRARLREIAATGHTRIVIIHGDQDEVIPVVMGRALAQEISGIQLEIIAGAHHNDVLDLGAAAISAAMVE